MSDREALIEQVVSAWRPRSPDGGLRALPAWHDLSEEDRRLANDATTVMRRLEAALDPEGLSTTAHVVLAAIRVGAVHP